MHGLKAPKLGEQLENFLQNTWKTALKKASKGNDHFSELFLKGNSKNNLLCQKNPFLESSIATKHIPPLKFNIQPWKLTCPLKINGWKMYFLLKWSLFGGHVNFQGCRCGYFFGLWGTGVRWPPSDPIHLSGDFTPVARGTHGPPSRRARARAVEAQTARSAAGSVREAENCAWVRIRFRGMVYIYIIYIYLHDWVVGFLWVQTIFSDTGTSQLIQAGPLEPNSNDAIDAPRTCWGTVDTEKLLALLRVREWEHGQNMLSSSKCLEVDLSLKRLDTKAIAFISKIYHVSKVRDIECESLNHHHFVFFLRHHVWLNSSHSSN